VLRRRFALLILNVVVSGTHDLATATR
jgi:hypothetical protein